ncbi:DoxX family protein [Mycolicibacterium sp. YH-1]|uniref:DoxX family protein n=1 Tax=Mycolicibacterium sp. YH-1 TaxID=2908837 RepID=UPI001F4BDFB7|nr:DoxX family protein [Mycolicibacterium sp. YH-1]UNB50511.1 DoxX family protein [Mycolicibacterium sp. YH-1]
MTSTSHDPRAWQRPEGLEGSAVRPASARLVDPEDDVPSTYGGGDTSSTYGETPPAYSEAPSTYGEGETTAIPRYDSTPQQSAYGLLGEPEPLPYVQPGARHSTHQAEPTEVGTDPVLDDRVRAAGRRGTQDLGLMLLRVGLGALFIAHGLQKAFGWWGGAGLNGFEQSLADLGYQHTGLLTYAGVGAQVAVGVLLVLGLFTPLAAAGALAYLVNSLLAAVVAQQESGYFPFFLPEGHEYQVTLIVVAAALCLTGPGRYGFDAGRGWARRPFIGSLAALLLGLGVGIAVWALLNGANPLA